MKKNQISFPTSWLFSLILASGRREKVEKSEKDEEGERLIGRSTRRRGLRRWKHMARRAVHEFQRPSKAVLRLKKDHRRHNYQPPFQFSSPINRWSSLATGTWRPFLERMNALVAAASNHIIWGGRRSRKRRPISPCQNSRSHQMFFFRSRCWDFSSLWGSPSQSYSSCSACQDFLSTLLVASLHRHTHAHASTHTLLHYWVAKRETLRHNDLGETMGADQVQVVQGTASGPSVNVRT